MPEAGADLSKPFREGNLGHFLAAPSSERSISCHGFGNWSLPLVVELKRWADCDRVAEWTSGHLGSSWLAKPIKRKRIMVKALAALPPKPEVSAGSCRLNTSKFWLGLDFALAVIQSIHFCVRTPQPRPAEELETRALFLAPAPATDPCRAEVHDFAALRWLHSGSHPRVLLSLLLVCCYIGLVGSCLRSQSPCAEAGIVLCA